MGMIKVLMFKMALKRKSEHENSINYDSHKKQIEDEAMRRIERIEHNVK